MYLIIGSHFVPLEGKFLLIGLVIYIKCDSASNSPKCPLNNHVSIVQKLAVKISNTSTTFSQQVEITSLSKCLIHPLLGLCVNATLNNISVISLRSVLLVEESGVLGENHRPVTSH